jgi:acyl carrier protein
MDRDAILRGLRQCVIEHSSLDDAGILRSDTNLFDMGLLDSLMAVSLLAYCEEQFGCELDMLELTPENLSSLDTLADLVCAKVQADASK